MANSLLLNGGTLLAETAKSGDEDRANINLQDLDLLRLDNESLISANANNQAKGGNVTIDSTFIVATPPTGSNGSDITANAQQGNGGQVNITTQGLFGIRFRPQLTPQNDITVSSESGIPGTFQLDNLAIDPSQGLDALPTNLVDRTNQIDQSCSASGANQQNQLTVTGRGGLPQSPTEVLAPDMVLDDFGTPVTATETEIRSNASPSPRPTHPPNQLVEAQSWMIGSDGKVILTASASNATPHQTWQTSANCQVSQTATQR